MQIEHPIAETERLTVGHLSEEHVTAIALLWCDARVTRFMGGPRDFQKVCASLQEGLNAQRTFDLWPVIEKATGKVVGDCGLLRKNVDDVESIELVYVIAADRWGCGYASEAAGAIRDHAFHRLNVPRLVALIDPANAASERVALKVGMTFCRETVRPGGRTMRVYEAWKPTSEPDRQGASGLDNSGLGTHPRLPPH